MEDLLFLKNEGNELSQEDHHVLDCANSYIKLYNTAMKRMTAVHDMNERRQKVLQVQKEGLEFHKHFVLAFGQTAVTPYVHCLVMRLQRPGTFIYEGVAGDPIEVSVELQPVEKNWRSDPQWSRAAVPGRGP
jgi:hypothetical protein